MLAPDEAEELHSTDRHGTLPPISRSDDAEVDIAVLQAVPKQFRVEDHMTANWLIKKVTGARQYADRVRAWADQEVRRAEREEHTLMYLYGRQIENWARAEIQNLNGRRKSIALPAGTVGFRSTAAKLVIDDERRVLSWAKSNLPNAIVVVEKLSKTAIDEYSIATGVIPDDGVHVEPASERFLREVSLGTHMN